MSSRILQGALVALLVSSVVPGTVCAQPGGGLTSYSLLRLSPSARAASLGGAFAAVADGDVNALFYNPSIPGPATSRRASFSYLNHLSDLSVGSVAYSHTVRGIGTTVHGGLRFAHWGEFEGRNRFGEPTGEFGAGEAALTLGASRPYGPRIRYGASMHVMHAQIEQAEATALAVDLGGVYRVPKRQLTVGVSLRNLGVVVDDLGQEREDLPLDLQIGASKRLAHLPVLLTATAYDLTNLSRGVKGGETLDHVLSHLTFGAELQPGDILRLRVGYNHRRSTELALTDRFDFAGVGLGFGVAIRALTVDYAYNSWSSLGGLHQFSLRTDLSQW